MRSTTIMSGPAKFKMLAIATAISIGIQFVHSPIPVSRNCIPGKWVSVAAAPKKTVDSVLFVKKSGIKKAARSFIKQDESSGV
ncbi:MAG TPA: hypothetical protein VNX27_11730 [Chthoniobacterales bacterium]|nr:hypothetical protein [Chthoniobacterales bacterium]